MTFYLIGLGMNLKSISAKALESLKSCDKIYLENYTVNFPYEISELEDSLNNFLNTNFSENDLMIEGGSSTKVELEVSDSIPKIKIDELDRQKVENESIIQEAKNQNIALLVYGDALSATTHIQLILAAKERNIEYKIFHSASILTTIANTGLSLYKLGKTCSMPNWEEHTNKPTSFINYIRENLSIKAHTLILTDIGLDINNAIEQLKKSTQKEDVNLPEKIIAISKAGTPSQKIFYDSPENLKNIEMPFCLIIPSVLSHIEEEVLEALKE